MSHARTTQVYNTTALSYKVFQKSSPPKTFGNIFTLVVFLCEILQICWQFTSTYIYQFFVDLS